MTQIDKKNGGDFTLFFLAFPRPEDEGKSMEELAKGRASRVSPATKCLAGVHVAQEGLIELTHNHGALAVSQSSLANPLTLTQVLRRRRARSSAYGEAGAGAS